MRKLFYITLFTFLLCGILYYLVSEAISPYDENGVLVVSNLITVSSIVCLILTLLFTVAHASIDKLFFRKFYQDIRLGISLRRGFLLALCIVTILNMKIFGYSEIQYLVMIALLTVLIEVFFILIIKKPITNTTKSIDHKSDV